MDKFEQMRVFIAVVDAGGFSAAAERLDMAKSAVSRRVSELEDRLGVRLLNRTTRRISLTEGGRVFHRRSKVLLADLEDNEAEITQAQGALKGALRIATPLSFGLRHLGPAIEQFMQLHPQVIPDLDLNDREVDLVHEGFDLAVRIGLLADSTLIARRLSPIHRVVCASPDYLRQYGEPRTPMDLERHPCLHYSNLSRRQGWQFPGPDGRPLQPNVHFALQANNGNVLADAAIAGLGVVLGPSFILSEHVQSGSLIPLLQDYPLPELGLYVLYPSSRHLSRRARAFVDFLAERFGERPYWDEQLN